MTNTYFIQPGLAYGYNQLTKLVCSLLLLILMITTNTYAIKKIYLHDNWTFHQEGKKESLSATIPGVVHLDLLHHGKIPDPYIGTNEDSVQWIERENWVYEQTFDLPNLDPEKNYDLIFEGLDTYAEVYLNNQLLLSADNMFREWKKDVKALLKSQGNSLRILFKSPIKVNEHLLNGPPYHKTAGNESAEPHVSVYTRKAPHHFGWDWGPRLVTCGIWRPVYIQEWETAQLEDIQLYQKELTAQKGIVELQLDLNTTQEEEWEVLIKDSNSGQIIAEGKKSTTLQWSIENPILWWPHNIGTPHLYQWTIVLKNDNKVLEERALSFGFRTIELINEPDEIGESFYFKVNGVPVFMKGANYIPGDALLPRRTNKDIDKLLADAKDANMNMIRVWGGGTYESDYFYNKCDEMGILIWQDFMFACSMYPADEPFLTNIKNEVEYNVRRLRNHPCIAIWCGNNEVDVAWHNWGWQLRYMISKKDSKKMWGDYQTIFHETIPSILKSCDPDRPFTSTSPLSNWGKLKNFDYASMHFWGVWHGRQPFSDYKVYVGRFMSEYGFQSFPDWKTIETFARPDQYDLSSTVMKKHQKSYIGNGMIASHTRAHFGKPKNFQEFVYKSQLTQLYGIGMAIKAHRAKKGHCMGSLYWQLNDCWPGPSWSSIDYYGRWKALHYALPELYHNILIVPEQDFNNFFVKIVSDELQSRASQLIINVKDFSGNLINSETIPLSIEANASKEYVRLNTRNLIKKKNKKRIYIELRLEQEGKLITKTTHFLTDPKYLKLKQPKLEVTVDKEKKILNIRSNTFVQALYLYAEDSDIRFRQNYMNIEADTDYQISFDGDIKDDTIRWLSCN